MTEPYVKRPVWWKAFVQVTSNPVGIGILAGIAVAFASDGRWLTTLVALAGAVWFARASWRNSGVEGG